MDKKRKQELKSIAREVAGIILQAALENGNVDKELESQELSEEEASYVIEISCIAD